MQVIKEVQLENKLGNHNKFYHITLGKNANGWNVVCQYGRIGNSPQKTIKMVVKCMNKEKWYAEQEFDKVYTEKIGKGYKEVGGKKPILKVLTPAVEVLDKKTAKKKPVKKKSSQKKTNDNDLGRNIIV